MRRLIFIFVLIIAITSGCDKISKLTQFNLEYDETVEVPATLGVNIPFSVQTPDIETNSESSFSVNDTRKENIEKIILTEMNLSVGSPADGTFSFLKSIKVYISADNLDEIEIAWKNNVPENIGDSLSLETTDADLKEYIKKESFNLKVTTVTDEIIATNYSIDIHSVFFVDAKILGF